MGERTVNIRQLKVLKWIVAGCPEGVMTGSTHKTTSVALQNRRLAKVSKRKGVWKAEATDAQVLRGARSVSGRPLVRQRRARIGASHPCRRAAQFEAEAEA
jgi:hypothetical protein